MVHVSGVNVADAEHVAGLVGAVLGELHREPAEGRPMEPRKETLDDTLGDEVKVTHPGGAAVA